MKRLAQLAILVLVLLVPASLAAAASFPQPKDSTVVVPTSIAGISIGMKEAKAKAAWGASRGHCVTAEASGNAICEYGSETGSSGYARVSFIEGKVTNVSVFAGKSAAGKYLTSAAGALMALRTKDGIGLGSKLSDLKRALPKGEASGEGFRVRGKGTADFSFALTANKVYGFTLDDG